MIGRKIYYELATGDVVLITEEKQGLNAANTTKEQDFAMYSPLQVRDPETIDFIQLEYGQYAAEFQVMQSIKVDPDTKEIMFEYPVYSPPLTTTVNILQQQNTTLLQKNVELEAHNQELQEQLDLVNEALDYVVMNLPEPTV